MNTELEVEAKVEIEMRDIEGYEGEYAVTRDGRVYSYKSNKFLSPYKNRDGGYPHVDLCKNGTRTSYSVHRLVAQAFIPNPENKETVDHIDRNRLNNNVENLRWATYQEQWQNKDQEANKQHLEKMTEKRKKKTAQISIETGETIQVFASCREAARALGDENKNTHISDVCLGKKKTAYGYCWEYVD